MCVRAQGNSKYKVGLAPSTRHRAALRLHGHSLQHCGRGVTLYNPTSGTMVQATVEDKCMGCVDRAIDCTDILFNQVTDGLGSGRTLGIEWWPEVVVVKGNTENP
jgi:hypothetical protein